MYEITRNVLAEVRKAVVGKDDVISKVWIALLAEGHVLLEDVPGAQARCRDCLDRLDRGDELAQAVRQSGVLPPAECRLLALGVRSGSGDRVMEYIARRLGQAGEDALEDRVSQVEPALVGVTSVLVGIILLSVMLPLMHIMSAIG